MSVDFILAVENVRPPFAGDFLMELAGLEPATSWVRSSRFVARKTLNLERFYGERLECRNISRNTL
jgi:hypothetical protein